MFKKVFVVVSMCCSIFSFLIEINKMLKIINFVSFFLLRWLPIITILFLLITLIILWLENRQLRCKIHDGLKFTLNSVKINVDMEKKVYSFSYEKRFKIISKDGPKYYKGQFYCNQFLEDADKTKEYYSRNKPYWDELNVCANMQYKRRHESKYSEPIKLKVVPITDVSYYIPFHILFESTNGESGIISLEQGTEIILNYSYTVPASLWGSYLNRSLSYFGEKAEVIFQHPLLTSKKIKVSLHRLSPNIQPEELSTFSPTKGTDNTAIYEIKIPSKSFARFRVWWDSDALMGIPTTKNVVDDSKMTMY